MTIMSSTLPPAPQMIGEEDIQRLVHTFYGRVRRDDLIGPIFNDKIEDWDEHLAKLCDFWSAVILRTRRFEGRPMQTHLLMPQIESRHFDRWLDLFETTARDVLGPERAAVFVHRARMIADSFEFGMANQRGEIAQPRHVNRPN